MMTTETASAWLRPDGILQIRINNGVKQSLGNARENLGALRRLAGDARAPVLIDMSGALPLDPDVRHYYADTQMDDSFTAMALVISSTPLNRMMGNVYFRVANTGVAMKLFATEEEAAAWLLGKPNG